MVVVLNTTTLLCRAPRIAYKETADAFPCLRTPQVARHNTVHNTVEGKGEQKSFRKAPVGPAKGRCARDFGSGHLRPWGWISWEMLLYGASPPVKGGHEYQNAYFGKRRGE